MYKESLARLQRLEILEAEAAADHIGERSTRLLLATMACSALMLTLAAAIYSLSETSVKGYELFAAQLELASTK